MDGRAGRCFDDHQFPARHANAVLKPPSGSHWLGTTQTGEDVFAQLLYGARVSLDVGALATVVATILSVTIGIVGGYARGAVDGALSVLTSVFLVIPALPLLIVLAGYLPNKGIESVAIVISVTAWAGGARVIRSQTLSVRRRTISRPRGPAASADIASYSPKYCRTR